LAIVGCFLAVRALGGWLLPVYPPIPPL